MIPILYAGDETAFTTNGLGGLSDAIYCDVAEERNGEYELEMQYPIQGRHFSDLAMNRFILAKPSEDAKPQPFAIYSISKPINGKCTINAEHLSYRMNYIPIMPFEANGLAATLTGLKDNSAEDNPFTLWTDKTSSAKYSYSVPSSLRRRLGGEEASVLQTFGGEYEWDKWTVKLWNHRGKDNGVVIRYGKNLVDLKQEESIANTFTGVCPYWKGLDDEGNEVVVTLQRQVVHSSHGGNFPYERTIAMDFSEYFDSRPTRTRLYEVAQAYVDQSGIGVPSVNLEVSFTQLWQSKDYENLASIEKVSLCDTVSVLFEELGVTAKAKVIKTVYDSLNERYKSVVIGDAKSSLAGTIASQGESISSLRSAAGSAIANANSLSNISGGTLNLGSFGNNGGVIRMLDTNDTIIGYLDNQGLHLTIDGVNREVSTYVGLLENRVSHLEEIETGNLPTITKNSYSNTINDDSDLQMATITTTDDRSVIVVSAEFSQDANGLRMIWLEDGNGTIISETETIVDAVADGRTTVRFSFMTSSQETYTIKAYQDSGSSLGITANVSVLGFSA